MNLQGDVVMNGVRTHTEVTGGAWKLSLSLDAQNTIIMEHADLGAIAIWHTADQTGWITTSWNINNAKQKEEITEESSSNDKSNRRKELTKSSDGNQEMSQNANE